MDVEERISMQGSAKASVLPDPVSAMPITSRPDNEKGHEAACIGVGAVKEANGDLERHRDGGR
jgi:hypothetical protein